MPKTCVIVNPASCKGKTNLLINDLQKITRELKFELFVSEYPSHIIEYLKSSSADFERIIGLGGDGTLNEMVNGIDSSREHEIGILPFGSGNDFASYLDSNRNFQGYVNKIVNNNYELKPVDIGLANIVLDNNVTFTHKFANCLGIGFDAFVAATYKKMKYISGNLGYVASVVKSLGNLFPLKSVIMLDGRELIGDYLLLANGNGVRSGGGFYLNPDAKIDDGFLDLTLLNNMGKFKLLKQLPKALFNKTKEIKEAEFYSYKECNIKMNKGYFVHCDGEIIAESAKEISISCLEKELNMIRII